MRGEEEEREGRRREGRRREGSGRGRGVGGMSEGGSEREGDYSGRYGRDSRLDTQLLTRAVPHTVPPFPGVGTALCSCIKRSHNSN